MYVNFYQSSKKENIDDDPEEPYQFEVDKNLDAKFPKWKEVFMSMLIERVKITQGTVNDCETVLAKSGEYRSSQDYLDGYVKERIEKTDETKFIIWSELQEDFKDWYISLYGGKVPRGQELKDYMNKKFGKPQRILDGENGNKDGLVSVLNQMKMMTIFKNILMIKILGFFNTGLGGRTGLLRVVETTLPIPVL